MKTCTKCGIHKPLDKFGIQRDKKDGKRSHCISCRKISAAEYREKNREVLRAKSRQRQQENPEKCAEYYQKHREHLLQKSNARSKLPEVRKAARAGANRRRKERPEYYRNREALWRKNNPGIWAANGAKYRGAKIQRTPSWSETEAIKEFYASRPEGSHVDHIIPLQGETVSGLHVLGNLQYLTSGENLRKGNKF